MCGPWSSLWAACACWMNDRSASALRKSPPAASFSEFLRCFPLAPAGLPGGKQRKEALHSKASESAAHVAGFGLHLEGCGPPSHPKRFFDSLRRPAGVKPAGRLLARLAGKRGRAPRPKNPRFWPKCGENAHKSKEIYTKEQETLDRASKKEYNTILHQYAQ